MPYKDLLRKRAYDRAYWRNVKKRGPEPVNVPIGTVKPLPLKGPRDGFKIAVLPDVQALPGANYRHLEAYGNYIADKRPDVIVCLGDFGDFPSLSHYERNTIAFEGRRYKKDLAAFHEAMETFLAPIQRACGGSSGWDPAMEFCLGNHEDHIRRVVHEDPKLEGLISIETDLRLPGYGWRVHEFLQPISIGGVAFCHYFPSGILGKPITAARMLLTKLHMSAVAGHQQGWDIAYGRRADGGHMAGIIAGSFYTHTYSYLSPFTNAHWRGAFFLHEVKNGQFDEMKLSVQYLIKRWSR